MAGAARRTAGRVAAESMSSTFSSWDAREVGERVGRRRTRSSSSPTLDLLVGADRNALLRQDVERVALYHGLLHLAREPPLGDQARLAQVGAELREDAALRDRGELVAGAADSLQAERDGLRRLDLHDEVDRAHVDPELERRRGDQARDRPRFSGSSTSRRCSRAMRAVVGARDFLLGELVQAQREPLGQATVVDEDDRRAVLLDQAEQLRVDRRPDRRRVALAAGAEQRIGVRACARLAHVLDRDDDAEVQLLARAGIDDPDRPSLRRQSGRSPRSGAASPRGRRAAPAATPAGPGARPTARGVRRASCRRPREPRRGSASRPCAASPSPAR